MLNNRNRLSDLQIEVVIGKLKQFKEHLGIIQHHDAITGTAMTSVNKDYLLRNERAINNAFGIVQDALLQDTGIEF